MFPSVWLITYSSSGGLFVIFTICKTLRWKTRDMDLRQENDTCRRPVVASMAR